MKTATKVLTAIALLAALLSGAVFALTLTASQGAPQEAAGSAMALYLVVAPYCVGSGRRWRVSKQLARTVREQL